MKKILFVIMATLVLISCQETAPTCSPTEAVIYVGDTLQLTVTGETNPSWSVAYSPDSTGIMSEDSKRLILEVIEGNRVIGVDTGRTEVFFFWYPEHHINGCADQQIGCTVTVLPNAEKKNVTGVLYLVDAYCTERPCIHDWDDPDICVDPMAYFAIVSNEETYFIDESSYGLEMDSQGETILTILGKQFILYKDVISAYGEVTTHLSVHGEKYHRINIKSVEKQ